MPGNDISQTPAARPRGLPALRGTAGGWLAVFAVSLGLFLVRFLLPSPVGQADNRDGPRLMCGRGFGLGPVLPHGDPRYFRFAYFTYLPQASCGHRTVYPTSQIVPLELARLLTPVLGLRGTINLVALGVLMCVITAIGIASLVVGLRIAWWARLVIAAAVWLIMADATFFDLFASPFEEPAVLVGLLLVTAGVLYLGRSPRGTLTGLALAGTGGFLAILAKEQYLLLAVPICLTLILASARQDRQGQGDGRGQGDGATRHGLRRYRTRQTAAAAAVAVVLALLAGTYATWDARSHYAQRLHHIQAVDTIFVNIVNRHDHARADLRALGLPVSWKKYAGRYYWHPGSVRTDPLYERYLPKLTDGNITHFLLTHPGRLPAMAQQAAVYAQEFQVTALGDYPPEGGHPPGTVDSRLVAVTWLVHRLPHGLGLYLLIPLWLALAAVAVLALRRRARPWHRDAAAALLCLIGCAIAAYVPAAFFAGISTTRHMVGMNLANSLAVVLAVALAASMLSLARRRAPEAGGRPSGAARAESGSLARSGEARQAEPSRPAPSPAPSSPAPPSLG